MSLRLRLLTAGLRRFEKPALARKSIARVRRDFGRKMRWLTWPPSGTTRTTVDLDGVEALHLSGPWTQSRTLLYFHGGGYVFGAPETHMPMVARLAQLVGADAYLPRYRLAPEHGAPSAFEDACRVFDALPRARPLVLGGDSAGGGLALALLSDVLVSGKAAPEALFALSPLTDLTFSAPSLTANARREAVLPASRISEFSDLFLNGLDPRDPRVSPLFASFPGAPPVHLSVSDSEILRDDSHAMAQVLRAQRAPVVLTEVADHPHVWPIFHNWVPEGDQTLADIAAWIRQNGSRQAGS